MSQEDVPMHGWGIKDPNARGLMILIIWLSMNPMMVFRGAVPRIVSAFVCCRGRRPLYWNPTRYFHYSGLLTLLIILMRSRLSAF